MIVVARAGDLNTIISHQRVHFLQKCVCILMLGAPKRLQGAEEGQRRGHDDGLVVRGRDLREGLKVPQLHAVVGGVVRFDAE
jgi:hypothetical protein